MVPQEKACANVSPVRGSGRWQVKAKKLCACGCGQITKRYRDYLNGHWHRGKKHGKEWIERASASLKRAYSDGKMPHILNQTPEFIEKRIAPLRGRKLSPDQVELRRKNTIAAWGRGAYSSEETRAKMFAHISKLGSQSGGSSAEYMAMIGAKRDIEALRPMWSKHMSDIVKGWKESGHYDAIRRKAGIAKGMLDHLAAKHWVISDPCGTRYEVDNMTEWARQHEHLFEDDRQDSGAPFYKRIAAGFSQMVSKRGKSCSYRGWVTVSNSELVRGEGDLLQRSQCLSQGDQ
jgi:hypothetical protein